MMRWRFIQLTPSKHSSGNKKMEEDAHKDTEKKLAEIKKLGKSKGQKVVDDLLNAVVKVTPEPPSR
jgi:V-type H+-transporting ATPase subunit G